MTITTPDPTDTDDATSVPFDLYREVHKGLRRALFQLTMTIGSADCESADQRNAVIEQLRGTITLLHHHHAHEDEFIQPLLAAHDPALAVIVDDGHAETEQGILELELDAARLAAATGTSAVAAGLDLYRRTALFTAHYLAHMALEEGGAMIALRGAMTDDELLAVEMRLRGAVAPPAMCAFITVMVPAMNRSERADMLGGMQAGAPPEVFELFRASAEAALDPHSYRILASDIGIA